MMYLLIEMAIFQKKKLPCITTSGTFSARNEKGLVQHSGFMCIDLDAKDQVVKFDIEEIKKDPYVYAVHQSVGGFGYAIFFRINPEKHKESYFGLEKYFLEKYKLIADPLPKNVASLRYVSYDPDIYINEKAKVFKSYPKRKRSKMLNFTQQRKTILMKLLGRSQQGQKICAKIMTYG